MICRLGRGQLAVDTRRQGNGRDNEYESRTID